MCFPYACRYPHSPVCILSGDVITLLLVVILFWSIWLVCTRMCHWWRQQTYYGLIEVYKSVIKFGPQEKYGLIYSTHTWWEIWIWVSLFHIVGSLRALSTEVVCLLDLSPVHLYNRCVYIKNSCTCYIAWFTLLLLNMLIHVCCLYWYVFIK